MWISCLINFVIVNRWVGRLLCSRWWSLSLFGWVATEEHWQVSMSLPSLERQALCEARSATGHEHQKESLMKYATPSLQTEYDCGYGGLKAPMPPHSINLPTISESASWGLFVWLVENGECRPYSCEASCEECLCLAQCSEETQGTVPFFLKYYDENKKSCCGWWACS